MITWFTRNPVAANLLMLIILVSGLFSLFQSIPLEIFPQFEANRITVGMSLRGGTPEDVEKGITIRIEEAVQDLEGVQEIISTSTEGSSNVSIEVESSFDPRDLLADVKSRVDAINSFPSDSERPVISLAQRRRDVIVVTLASVYSEKETREYVQTIYDDLLQIDGITQLELDGVRNYEIAVEVSQDQLQQYGITLNQLSAAIANSSIDLSAGNLRTEGGDILIRSTGQAYQQDEFALLPVITQADGSIVRLGEVAHINDGFEETPVRTRFNGKTAVFLEAFTVGNQSAIDVAASIREYIDAKQATLPEGFELSYWDDDSQILKNRLSTLAYSALQGGVLVLALLTLFLRPSIAIWVFVGIPISFMGALIFMPAFGVTLNVLSLYGFILVLGIVVDDAIVTGESVYSYIERTESGEAAAIEGTKAVAAPVTFGVLTTIAAFVPLAFIEGDRSVLFNQIPYVVVPILLFSLIESKFILPAHLRHIQRRRKVAEAGAFERFQKRFADGFERSILVFYQPILRLVLRHKLATLFSFVVMLGVITALMNSGWMRFTFFPRIPRETLTVDLTMPTGTPFEVTNRHTVELTESVEHLREKYRDANTGESVVTNILTSTGGRGGSSHRGRVQFEITPPEKRELNISAQQLLKEWRESVGTIPGAESVAFRAEWGRASSPIDIQLSSSSLSTLDAAADLVKARLATYPTTFDIADSLSDGKEELQIELTDQGRALGFTRAEVTRQVRQAYFGAEAQRIQRGRDDIRVMVRLPLDERRSLSDLEDMLIRVNGNQAGDLRRVPLSHVAQLIPSKGPSAIRRVDRNRTVNVTADVDKDNTNMTVLEADLVAYLGQLSSQYPGLSYSLEGEAREQRESFNSLNWALLGVLFAIYVLLAIPFKSYVQPLIVMSVIPFGAVGAVAGHWIMGMNLTLLSLLGMLALIGVVVNDSLVLVDYINKKREQSVDLQSAVMMAGVARFRPVMLTSLTTFIGLVPLLFEKSTQAQYLIPMGVSLGFGILFATFITLLLVPVNYLLMEQAKAYGRQCLSLV